SAHQKAKFSLMRNAVWECYCLLPSLCKLGPEHRYGSVEFDFVFLQPMQQTCAADSFRRRPTQDERVSRPRLLVARVAKPAVKIDHRFPVLPNRHRSAQFAELFEVFLEQRFQSLKK